MSDTPAPAPAALQPTPPAPTMPLGEALLARAEGRMSEASYQSTYAPLLVQAAAAKGSPLTQGDHERADWQAGKEAKASLEASIAAGEEARFGAALDVAYRPADSIGDYQIPRIAGRDVSPEEAQVESGLRAAMFEAKLPAFTGNAIANRLDQLGREVTNPAQIQSHVRQSAEILRSTWGDQHQARTEKVTSFLAELSVKHPMLGAMIDNAPHLFGDPQVAQQIWNVIEHRSRGR